MKISFRGLGAFITSAVGLLLPMVDVMPAKVGAVITAAGILLQAFTPQTVKKTDARR